MNPNAVLKFLQSLRSLAKSGVIKSVDEAFDFAKREFGEINDLLKRQIEQVFKKPVDKAPKPGEGGITSIKNAPKKRDKNNLTDDDPMGDLEKIVKNEGNVGLPNDQASGIMASEEASPLMQKLEKGADILREFKRPGMDLTTGMARTAARVILDNAGIKVPEKVDPLEVIAKEFGADVLMDLKDVAEELIEKERTGKITESMGEFLESRGMFNLQRGRTDAPKGMSDEELEQIKKQVDQEKQLKDFDPKDDIDKKEIDKAIEQENILLDFDPKGRKPSAVGGIQRLQFKLGGTKKLLALIKEIKKLSPIEAMKEVNEVVAKRGKYENLSDTEVKTIFDETNDHIFERDVPADEFAVRFDEEVDLPEGVDPRDTILPMDKKILDDVDEAYGMAPKMVERFQLKERFPGIPDELLTQIIDDPDPQNKAEAISTLDQAMELTKQGKDTDEIISVLERIKKSRRDNSKGGLQYLMGM